MNYFLLAAVVGAAAVIVMLRRRHLWEDVKEATAEAMREARADIDRFKRDKEADAIVEYCRGLARPSLLLRPDPSADPVTAAARLGGKAWLAEGEEWPVGPDGEKLEFVAQLDFAGLPPLPGFPNQGVARFFVGRDDIWGADFDEPDRSNIRVLWHEGPQTDGRHEPPPAWGENENSPFESESVREDGLALRPEPAEDLPDFYSWQVQQRLEGYRNADSQEIEDRLFEIHESREFAHRIGGHPSFTQYDFRGPGKYDDLDVVLLGLTSDDAIMWGDVGEAAFYIRQQDLDRRDFSRVAFYWDCH